MRARCCAAACGEGIALRVGDPPLPKQVPRLSEGDAQLGQHPWGRQTGQPDIRPRPGLPSRHQQSPMQAPVPPRAPLRCRPFQGGTCCRPRARAPGRGRRSVIPRGYPALRPITPLR